MSFPILALLALLMAGCISSRQISVRAVDYNVAAADARNEMLLLNVLRARDRKPMVFTGLSRITGSIRAEARVGAAVQAGGDASDVQVVTPSAGFSDAPSFDVAVLDSQEFTRGIMTPLRFKLLEYLWDQGFNREVLLYLTVERIELDCTPNGDAAPQRKLLINDPTEDSFPAFRALLEVLADDGDWEADPHQTERIGPSVGAEEVGRLPVLVQVAGSDLDLRELDDGTWQLERPSSNMRLKVSAESLCGPESTPPGPLRLYDSKATFERALQQAPAEFRGRAVLRSPQAVLYFLGEMTRPGRQVLIRQKRESQPVNERLLFTVRPAADCSRAHVNVRYDSARFIIPNGEDKCHPGRSLQSLQLAAQLLALQQSSSNLPATGTVRIIGQ
jgi:hypothetical protein